MAGRGVRGIIAALAAAGLGLAAWVAWPLPADLLASGGARSLELQDRHGITLRGTRSDDGSLAAWVPLTAMDPDLPRAFIAVEDRRFHAHHGVDVRAAVRALRDNLTRRQVVSGASTIPMQLARLLRPIGHGYRAKVAQVAWALRLEAHLSKSVLLEQYLNRVPLGQGTVGVDAASRLYFNSSARQVSLGQAALLAALARAPSSRNPLVDPTRAAERRLLGLRLLGEAGYATTAEIERARREPLLGPPGARPFLAPHFTSRVLLWGEASGRALDGTWRTSLDLSLQSALESEVRHTVDLLADRGVRQAAVVVLDNRSGEILAYVGSPDFWADTAGQVDMVTSPRQPGSALKPLLYGLAFDRGVTAATVLADIATTYQTAGGPYHPRNYDRRFHGPVRAREALASSYNLPAVALADRLGAATLLRGLQHAGFVSLSRSPEFYGLGLALGNGDVTLLELANGYRALANGGAWTPTRWWLGDDVPSGEPVRVVSPGAAALVLDILSDPVARIPGFGISTPFDWPFRVAAKTGTSRHFTDNWAVATTANFTVAVWAGNFSGQPMEGVSGITGAGPLLHRAVLVTAQLHPPGDLVHPAEAGLRPVTVCRLSGRLATAACPGVTEYFLPGTEPTDACDWHQDGGVTLPAEYAEWQATEASDRRGTSALASVETEHTETTRRRGDAATPSHLTIVSPLDGDRYQIPPGVDGRYATIALRAAGAGPRERLRWTIDGQPVTAPRWSLVPGRHVIRVSGATRSDEVTIQVE